MSVISNLDFNNEKFEITTLRKDIKCDGRHTEVIFTDDFMEDATRRDFTINALSYCPFEHRIYDYFGGIDDLRESKVIFIGQPFKRIEEDFLRILRFFRFSCYYARQLDRNGLDACIKLQENLKLLSKERVKWDMDKLIISDNSPNILQQMFDNGILQIILPVSKFDNKPLMEAINFGSLEPYTRYSLLFYHIKNLPLSDLLNLKFSQQIALKIITILRFVNKEINEFTLREIWWETADYPDDYLQYIITLVSLGKLNRDIANKFLDAYQPIKGHDLQKLNIHGKAIGTVIGKLKKSWIASDFTLNKNQLLKLLEKMKINISASIFITIIMILLSQVSFANVGRIKIVTSITPLASIIAMLVKEQAEIVAIANNNDCPHHYN
ncbi:MAG: hypothetical protein ACEY3E_04610, partial [Candidatus Tisiphia sp.]